MFVYVSDLIFSEITDLKNKTVNGGAENNDKILVDILRAKGHDVQVVFSDDLTVDFLEANKNKKYIVSNFAFMFKQSMKYMIDNCKYIIYEHDHKYIEGRNPGLYKDYVADHIVNVDFYKSAVCVFVQSCFHENIIKKNFEHHGHEIRTYNVAGNLWSNETLNLLKELSTAPKKQVYSVMDSRIQHKNTKNVVLMLEAMKVEYELIPAMSHEQFLRRLAQNDFLAFQPLTPETLSRIVVEARMLGCSLLVSNNVGALHEQFIKLKGVDLIEHMRLKREEIPIKVIDFLS